MRDAELLLRYYSFKNFLSDYTGNLKTFLDNTCLKLNLEWDAREQLLTEQLNDLEEAHNLIKSTFSTNFYRKWTGSYYENRFNRSIFDVMLLSFSNPDVRKAIIGKEADVESAFKDLCVNSNEFRVSIESTTKSISATHKRISLWYQKLNSVVGTNLHVPQVIDNRIK